MFENNKFANQDIKAQQKKIKETIMEHKKKNFEDKFANAQEIYRMKQQAKMARSVQRNTHHQNTLNEYNNRIQMTKQQASEVD